MDEVANLATVGPSNRFDTLRPAPSRLICHAYRLDITQVHDLYLALVKGTYFFRRHQSSSLSSLSCRTSKPMSSVKLPRFGVHGSPKQNQTTREEKKVQKTDDEELKRQVVELVFHR